MTSIGARVRRRIRPYAGRVTLGVGLVTAGSLAELAKPWPLKVIVDQVLGGKPLPAVGFPEELDAPTLLLIACGGLVVLHAIIGSLTLAADRLTIDVGQRMVHSLRRDLFARLARLSVRFHDRGAPGDLVYRLAADTLSLQTLAMNAVFPTLSAALFLVGMIVVMLRLDATLTMLALAVLPFIALSMRLLGRRIDRVAREAKARESTLYATTETSLSAVRTMQAARAEPAELETFADASQQSLKRHLSLYTTQSAYALVVSVVGAAGTALVLWYGARLVERGTLTVGDLLVFAAYLTSFYTPVSTLTHSFGLVREASAGLRRVFEILDREPEIQSGDEPLERSSVRGEISLEAVEFAYDPGRPVLQGASLSVRPGEKLALVGPSGSGKTTIAHLLLRFLDPDAGFVRIDGVDVRQLRLEDLRGAFGATQQPPFVFPTTVRENVTYGSPEATEAEVTRALDVAQLSDVVAALPEGLETSLETAGARLSQGERQRLALARVLVDRPPILLLDEPTASLDGPTERRLLHALDAERGDRTCVFVTHAAAALAWADRIAVLQHGRIVALGTPDELAGRPELREAREEPVAPE